MHLTRKLTSGKIASVVRIQHRINTIEQLAQVPEDLGIELDIRSNSQGLYLHHDPFAEGELFDAFLKNYRHRFIILNTKEEGLEAAILALMKKYQIKDYFFLDLSLPFLVKYSKLGVKEIAIRYSEYEPLELASNFCDQINWVWIDCFSKLPLNKDHYNFLKNNFKLCVVSPELQGHDISMIDSFKKQLKDMPVDAVCTKRPDLW